MQYSESLGPPDSVFYKKACWLTCTHEYKLHLRGLACSYNHVFALLKKGKENKSTVYTVEVVLLDAFAFFPREIKQSGTLTESVGIQQIW